MINQQILFMELSKIIDSFGIIIKSISITPENRNEMLKIKFIMNGQTYGYIRRYPPFERRIAHFICDEFKVELRKLQSNIDFIKRKIPVKTVRRTEMIQEINNKEKLLKLNVILDEFFNFDCNHIQCGECRCENICNDICKLDRKIKKELNK